MFDQIEDIVLVNKQFQETTDAELEGRVLMEEQVEDDHCNTEE